MISRYSVALTDTIHEQLSAHLLKYVDQEEICLIRYKPSTGATRMSALIGSVVFPTDDDRELHGNVSFAGSWILREASAAAAQGEGIGIAHSHPGGVGWQHMSLWDEETEKAYAYLVSQVTGLPLVGMTLAGDETWSARVWTEQGEEQWCESVRVLGAKMTINWNDLLRPPPPVTDAQPRTLSAWGRRIQEDLARMRVLVVGGGSVGLDVAIRLAATGVTDVYVMDPDTLTVANRDRITYGTEADAKAGITKADLASKEMRRAATAEDFVGRGIEGSICTTSFMTQALDYDIIISCVDRPWPRAVLNVVAYADLIPVIDGGISLDVNDDGDGMRGGTWRTHVLRPARACAICNKQLDPSLIYLDRAGLLTPEYIHNSGRTDIASGANVAAFCGSVSSSLLGLLISMVVAPGGQGEPGPLQFQIATHWLKVLPRSTHAGCLIEQQVAYGDDRLKLTDD